MEHKTEADAVAEIVANQSIIQWVGGIPVAITDKPIKDLTQYYDALPWKKGTAELRTLASFEKYMADQGDKKSAIFALVVNGTENIPPGFRLKGYVDFHSDKPGGIHHETYFESELTTPFRRLFNASKFTQLGFCELIEDVSSIIAEPNPAELLEMLEDLEGQEKTTFRSVVKRGSVVKVSGDSDTGVTNKNLPAVITFKGKPFSNTGTNNPDLQVSARLRVNIRDCSLVFSLRFDRLAEVWTAVGESVVSKMVLPTEIKPRVFFGTFDR